MQSRWWSWICCLGVLHATPGKRRKDVLWIKYMPPRASPTQHHFCSLLVQVWMKVTPIQVLPSAFPQCNRDSKRHDKDPHVITRVKQWHAWRDLKARLVLPKGQDVCQVLHPLTRCSHPVATAAIIPSHWHAFHCRCFHGMELHSGWDWEHMHGTLATTMQKQTDKFLLLFLWKANLLLPQSISQYSCSEKR